MKKTIKKKPALNELKLSSLNTQQLNQVIGGDVPNLDETYGYESYPPVPGPTWYLLWTNHFWTWHMP